MHIENLLLAGPLLLHGWLVALLLRRKVQQLFLLFLAYNIYAVLATGARLAALGHTRIYVYVFFATDPGFVALGIAALHQVFRWVFAGFYLLRWFRWFYYGGIALAVLIAVANSLLHPPADTYPLYVIILQFGIAVNCLQAAIFALFYLSARLLDVGFRRYAFGIVLGFGIASIGTLVPDVVRSEFGTRFENLFQYAPAVAYILSLVVWLSAFLKAEPEQEEWTPPMPPEQMAEEAMQYVRILRSFFGKRNDA